MIRMNDFFVEYQTHKTQILNSIDSFLAKGKYILDGKVLEFEKAYADYIGVKHCVGVANGMEAIQIALMASGVGSGDEVLVPSFTMAATAIAVVHVGATPVFVDIDAYFHIDPVHICRAITSKTKAIISVHLYGQMADMDAIIRIATEHKLLVIEDAAQAHGATFREKKAGSFGYAGCFSFYPTKNLGAYGDAGAITTNSNKLYKRCRMLRDYGRKSRYDHEMVGLNSRLDGLQAVILLHKLAYLGSQNAIRNRLAALYNTYLEDISEVAIPVIRPHATSVFHQYVILAKNREVLQKYLYKHNVVSDVHYPLPVHKQKVFSEFAHMKLPRTEHASGHVLSLPIHPLCTEKDIYAVATHIRRFYKSLK